MADYEAFTRYLAAAAVRPFAWGTWDCLVFAHGARVALHGHGFADDLMGRYTGPRGLMARSALRRRFGHSSLEAMLDARLTRVPCPAPSRGAVALLQSDGPLGGAFGVVTGARAAFLLQGTGLVHVALTECRGFWDRAP